MSSIFEKNLKKNPVRRRRGKKVFLTPDEKDRADRYKHKVRILRQFSSAFDGKHYNLKDFVHPEDWDESQKAAINSAWALVGDERALSNTIKALRKVADGYDTKDGFNIREIEKGNLPDRKQLQKMLRDAQIVKEYSTRPMHIYRSRDKEKLQLVQTVLASDPLPDNFKVAFVPKPSPTDKVIVKVDKKNRKVITEFPDRGGVFTTVPLDKEDLAVDVVAAVRKGLKQLPEYKYEAFMVMCGEGKETYQWGWATSHKSVINQVEEMLKNYSNPEANNYWGNWFTGVSAYLANTKKEHRDLTSTTRRYIKEAKQKREKANRAREQRLKRELDKKARIEQVKRMNR